MLFDRKAKHEQGQYLQLGLSRLPIGDLRTFQALLASAGCDLCE